MAKEPIRPGDVIEYYNPIFVYGNPQGLRRATVMSIYPKRKFKLVLDDGELLPKDHRVKRIKVLSKAENLLVDHPGITRKINQFKLKKLTKPHDLNIETEAQRMKRDLKGVFDTFKENTKNSGCPNDILLSYYGT